MVLFSWVEWLRERHEEWDEQRRRQEEEASEALAAAAARDLGIGSSGGESGGSSGDEEGDEDEEASLAAAAARRVGWATSGSPGPREGHSRVPCLLLLATAGRRRCGRGLAHQSRIPAPFKGAAPLSWSHQVAAVLSPTPSLAPRTPQPHFPPFNARS